jgi:predicted RNA binding protein YcfA (HicA-like mRNA interferase family)
MSRLPRLTGREIITALGKIGFNVVRIKGSHHILINSDGRRTVVPVHSGEIIGLGLLTQISRDCQVAKSDFEKLL